MLCDAIENDDMDEVRRLLKGGVDIDEIDFDHEATPLEKAAEERNVEATRLLLEKGATPDRAMISPALLIASTNGDDEIATLLLDGGANPNEPDEDGMTPLMGAAFMGHRRLVETLIAGGADPALRSRDGGNARSVAKSDDIRALLPAD